MAQISTVPSLIAGSFEESASDRVDEVPDPATGEAIANLPYSTDAQIDRAVQAARRAFPEWSELPVPDRAQVMFRFKALLESSVEELARLVTRENGKTLEEARGEVRRGIEVVDFACHAPTALMGSNLDQVARGIDEELVRFPVGVVVGITPFNFPVMVPLWMIPIALVAGNTFVLKPSQLTPLSAIRLAEMLTEVRLPAGVFNVVQGAREAVETLLRHRDVAAVSSVGSAAVASHIYTEAAASGKRVQALGGAKNHLVVMDDADLDESVAAIIPSAFGNAGQRCGAGSVAVAVGSVRDSLAKKLAGRAETIKVGPGIEPGVTMGPVIRGDRKRNLERYIGDGETEGAVMIRDGRGNGPSSGFFLGPTIFDRVTPDMHLWRDELFGPVLSVVRTDDLDSAIRLINSSSYGNMASIFTGSGKQAREFRQRVEAGMIGVNVGLPAPMAYFPFTGWKHSFFGDLNATGLDAFRFYTRHKVVTSRWL